MDVAKGNSLQRVTIPEFQNEKRTVDLTIFIDYNGKYKVWWVYI